MQVEDFFAVLKKHELHSFYGVPDSLLKSLCAYLTDNVEAKHHIITANEGNAVAMACGHYLATNELAVVYMQNSGLGNCVNPLLSLADEEVYKIPLLMLIGWRGEPGIKDEPQHLKQGKLTDKLLACLGVAYEILPKNINEAATAVEQAVRYMRTTNKPYAFLIQHDSFEEYKLVNQRVSTYQLSREAALGLVVKNLSATDIVVATTGQISRELYEYREHHQQSHQTDFLTVGSMGHASSIALAIAIEKPQAQVVCFDGDGACLMHLGALPVIAAQKLANFKQVVFNNEAHDSVGAQPTCAAIMNLTQVAQNCSYQKVWSVATAAEISDVMPDFLAFNGTGFMEIKVKCGARKDLMRPQEKPVENKESFMRFLNETQCNKNM